jgi:predicted transcriptional regulator of viral defense system
MVTALDIRDGIPGDVLDYQQLTSLLRGYAKPRDRITALLAGGELVRLRKGLYVLGERYRRQPLVREHLANLIYGPSYVSLDYALSRHGLIPERVDEVTSLTTGEHRRFVTPLGVFSYRATTARRYAPGVEWHGDGVARYLMASPEKALADKVASERRLGRPALTVMRAYLLEDLRIDADGLTRLDVPRLQAIAHAYRSYRVSVLERTIARLQEAHR